MKAAAGPPLSRRLSAGPSGSPFFLPVIVAIVATVGIAVVVAKGLRSLLLIG